MKKFLSVTILAATLFFYSIPVYAACTYQTYIINGRLITCTTCCYGNTCSTNCV